jgi:hypothetical protein
VRPLGVVVLDPLGDRLSGLTEAEEIVTKLRQVDLLVS